MFILQYERMSFDQDLQIVLADVYMAVDGETVVDEPLCIDVGLPALLASCMQNAVPDRWAPAAEWQQAPFMVCGCGDPECRAYCFVVEHVDDQTLRLTEVEQHADGTLRELDAYIVSKKQYREQVLQIAEHFLQFVKKIDYKPYFKETLSIIRQWVDKVRQS
jgi:hypothetical protein